MASQNAQLEAEAEAVTGGAPVKHGSRGQRSIRWADAPDILVISPRKTEPKATKPKAMKPKATKPKARPRSKALVDAPASDTLAISPRQKKPRTGSRLEVLADAPTDAPSPASLGCMPSESAPAQPKVTLKIPAMSSRTGKQREVLSRESVRLDAPGSG
jgi:hypothetical protein